MTSDDIFEAGLLSFDIYCHILVCYIVGKILLMFLGPLNPLNLATQFCAVFGFLG